MLDPATTWFLREYSRLCQRHGRRLHHPTAQCVVVVDEDAKSIQANVAELFKATEASAAAEAAAAAAEMAADNAKEGAVDDGNAKA